MTELSIVQGDITTLKVDAIVNAANSALAGGGGVDGAIHRAGGPAIAAECRAIVAQRGHCPPGQAVVTGAGDMAARLVIHTVGPQWDGPANADQHDATLASCYETSLGLAQDHKVSAVAFPNISTGVYGFPKVRAAAVAVTATQGWLVANPSSPIERIVFACFDDENAEIYRTLLGR